MSKPTQLAFDLEVRSNGREDYFVGDANQVAIDMIDMWPNWPESSPFLIVFGEEGSGKRHLASLWQEKSDAKIIDVATFVNEPLEVIRQGDSNLIIHNLHLLVGDLALETKLFHLNNYYSLVTGKNILLTSRIAPAALEPSLWDMESRLKGSNIVEIRNPDDTLLMKVLGKQLSDKGFQANENVLQYALTRMDRSWTAPKRLAEMMSKLGFEENKGATKPLIQKALLQLAQEESEPQPELSRKPGLSGSFDI